MADANRWRRAGTSVPKPLTDPSRSASNFGTGRTRDWPGGHDRTTTAEYQRAMNDGHNQPTTKTAPLCIIGNGEFAHDGDGKMIASVENLENRSLFDRMIGALEVASDWLSHKGADSQNGEIRRIRAVIAEAKGVQGNGLGGSEIRHALGSGHACAGGGFGALLKRLRCDRGMQLREVWDRLGAPCWTPAALEDAELKEACEFTGYGAMALLELLADDRPFTKNEACEWARLTNADEATIVGKACWSKSEVVL